MTYRRGDYRKAKQGAFGTRIRTAPRREYNPDAVGLAHAMAAETGVSELAVDVMIEVERRSPCGCDPQGECCPMHGGPQ